MSDKESDTEKLADMVFESVKVYVERFTTKAVADATAPLLAEIEALRKSIAEAPAPLTTGVNP